MTTSLFDRVSGLVDEIGAEKQAAAREKTAETGIPDPGGAEGATSHPSKKTDDDLQPKAEGFQSADNERIVKDQIPDAVDTKPEATEGNAPKATDTQQGQGVDEAKPTGEDPSTESDYKGKLEGDKREGDQGGTSHPATGSYGEKYSADAIDGMSDDDLLKSAADLGNELTADIANGHFSPAAPAQAAVPAAAAAGEKTAEAAGEVGNRLEDIASNVVQEVVKSAYHQADLVVDHLAKEMSALKKKAAEGETEDPTSGASEGEDHGTEEGGSSDPNEESSEEEALGGSDGGEEAPPAGAEELLAAMGGGGEMGGMPGGEMGGPEMGGEMGGMPGGEMGGMPGAEMGGMPGGPEMGGMGGPEMGGMPGAEMGGPPPEMGGMGNEQALQQLAMALMEAGIDPAQLAALANPAAEKIASAVHGHRRSGKFCFSEAKTGSAERKVRDYMKGFVLELYKRSRK